MVNFQTQGRWTRFFWQGQEVAAVLTPDGAEDSFFAVEGENALRWVRKTKQAVDRMVMELRGSIQVRHTMVPAVSYDGNPWGKDHEYKGYGMDGVPFTYAWHRTPVPGAAAFWNEEAGAALYGTGHCSGSIFIEDGKAVCRVIWPETEEPVVLYSNAFGPAYYGTMEKTNTFTAWLNFGTGNGAVKQMLHLAWKQNYHPVRPERNCKSIWDLSIAYAKLLYTEETDGFRGFSIGFTWDGHQWIKRPVGKYEIGWCGQNASLAVSLMKDYERNKREDSLRIAVDVLDCWLEKARSKEGFLRMRYDPGKTLIDACNLGTAGQQLWAAYEQALMLGIEKPAWKKAALEISEFVLERQAENGKTGMSWNEDGSLHESEGSAGAFLIWPLAESYRRTKKPEYLEGARKAYEYYYAEFAGKGYSTSGALDTCCIDKESMIPLLRGGLLLYRLTGEKTYLEKAEEAAWYLSTWQWHYEAEYPESTVLGRLHYNTFGGTAVSTSHHHMDPFALCYVPDLLELGGLTGKIEWVQRALAAWSNGVQLISDGTMQVPPSGVRPAGSCDEGYLQTRWCRKETAEQEELSGMPGWRGKFSVSQWLVAWPCAFRLEVLRKCADWEFLDGQRE